MRTIYDLGFSAGQDVKCRRTMRSRFHASAATKKSASHDLDQSESRNGDYYGYLNEDQQQKPSAWRSRFPSRRKGSMEAAAATTTAAQGKKTALSINVPPLRQSPTGPPRLASLVPPTAPAARDLPKKFSLSFCHRLPKLRVSQMRIEAEEKRKTLQTAATQGRSTKSYDGTVRLGANFRLGTAAGPSASRVICGLRIHANEAKGARNIKLTVNDLDAIRLSSNK